MRLIRLLLIAAACCAAALAHRKALMSPSKLASLACLVLFATVWVGASAQTSRANPVAPNLGAPPHGAEVERPPTVAAASDQYQRHFWFMGSRRTSHGLARDKYYAAYLESRRRLALRANNKTAAPSGPFDQLSWTSVAPGPVRVGSNVYSGRATSLAIDPANPGTLYLGTAGGGLWKSTDAGAQWQPLTDTQASLVIGAVTVDPNNPQIVWAGTGEPDFSVDSYFGQGLLKSTDGGSNWQLIRTPFTSGDTAADFNAIAVQPGNSNVVLAGNTAGVYRSGDGGATWKPVISGVNATVLFDRVQPNVVYAGLGSTNATPAPIVKSTDGGLTWAAASGTGSGALPSNALRVALAEDSTGTTLYAAIAQNTFTGAGYLYKSADGGATWTALSGTPGGDGPDWYRCGIVVIPGTHVLYTTGVRLWQSLDGGATWASVGPALWADQHGLAAAADGSALYVTDDGGVFLAAAPAAANPSFDSLNATLSTMTFYPHFAVVPNSGGDVLAGAQDHGIPMLQAAQSAWVPGDNGRYCGDGGGTYVDPQNSVAYAHCVGGSANWVASRGGGANTTDWTSAQNGIDPKDNWPWVAVIAGDPEASANVYTGTDYLYQTTDGAQTWTKISPELGSAPGDSVTAIAVAPTNSGVVYAGMVNGNLWGSANATAGANAQFARLRQFPNTVSGIAVTPASANELYAALGGFDTGHVFHSTDGGKTWADISGDLPNIPVNAIALDTSLHQTMYIATDLGVYYTINAGVNWLPLGTNLPNVVVQDLQLGADRSLVAITHGRGAWSVALPASGLAASVTVIHFGVQKVGTASASQTVVVTNLLNQSQTLNGVQVSGPFALAANGCAASLAPGATCNLGITFSPTAAGAANGTVTVAGVGNANLAIALDGSGATSAAALSSAGLTFPSQATGSTSSAQTVSVTNTSGVALNITAITASGDFSQTNTCGTSLDAGKSCALAVVFAPTATGSRTGSLTLTDDAPDSPQTVTLSGTGSDLTIAPTAGSATTQTVAAGQMANFALTLAPVDGLNGSFTLSCTGAPSGADCSPVPATVSFTNSTPASLQVSVTTTARSLTVPGAPITPTMPVGPLAVLAAVLCLALALAGSGARARPRRWLLGVPALALLSLASACSGSPNGSGSHSQSPAGTPAGTYSLTLTAADGSVTRSTSLTLVVQ